MAGNTFGDVFKITTFGESHGLAIGVVIDGCPSGLDIDLDFIQSEMQRRKPGQSNIVTQRRELDEVEIVSGIFEGKTTGTPLMMMIKNQDHRSVDYLHNKDTFRPSHADYTYFAKYGIRDYRGGGRSSARETAARVAAGSIAKQILKKYDIQVFAYSSSIGTIKLNKDYSALNLHNIDNNIVRCPDEEVAKEMISFLEEVKKQGDTVGGTIFCVIKNVPAGLGEPVFDKLQAELAKAMLSINAVKGFEYGSGFGATEMRGSEHNDLFNSDFSTKTNFSGGIQGGISNGEDIYFKVAFKPIATIIKKQQTVDVSGNIVEMQGKGRHDPCAVPRAVPIVEAMASITIVDFLLRNKLTKHNERI